MEKDVGEGSPRNLHCLSRTQLQNPSLRTVKSANHPLPSTPWEQVVDASRSIEDVHKEIRELCEDTIQAAMHRPLGELWT